MLGHIEEDLLHDIAICDKSIQYTLLLGGEDEIPRPFKKWADRLCCLFLCPLHLLRNFFSNFYLIIIVIAMELLPRIFSKGPKLFAEAIRIQYKKKDLDKILDTYQMKSAFVRHNWRANQDCGKQGRTSRLRTST